LRPPHERYAALRQYARPVRTVRRRVQPNNEGHVLAVMTCAGREKSLERTLLSLERAGLGRWKGAMILVADGPVEWRAHFDWWRLLRSDSIAGQAKTMLRVFEAAAEHPALTALTLIEDDVVLARNALDYFATTNIDDDLALISWFTTQNYRAPFSPFLRITSAATHQPSNAGVTFPAATVHAVLDRYFPTNQAITLPADTVRAVLDSRRLHEWPTKHGADTIFWEVPGKPCAVHYPNLVQHVGGLESLVGNEGARVSPTFLGEDADAFALLPPI